MDGFVLDWTCADECRVIDDGDEVELSSLDVDAEVGVRDSVTAKNCSPGSCCDPNRTDPHIAVTCSDP
ncbi:hypothetical protein [Micromonospora sp. LOL_015]|uniref:hypothetical protein n=1 Tax=Micromonospora sp. LOL_015 TaxID=3345416 RepID=UPI003A838F31